MSGVFVIGEQKVRPGTYVRYENVGLAQQAGAVSGLCAATVTADWGNIGSVCELESEFDVDKYYGKGGTTDVLREMFRGGAKTVKAVRLGSGGKKGEIILKDDSDKDALVVTMKYEGIRQFQLIIKESLDDTTKELQVIEGTTIRQKIKFEKGDNEVNNLIQAYKNVGSDWIIISSKENYDGTNILKGIYQELVLKGENPTSIENADYDNAFNLLAAYKWNVIAVDTNNIQVHMMLSNYMNSFFDTGKLCLSVIGEPKSVPIETRKTHAAAYNDFKVIYVGGGWVSADGVVYDGYMAAARIAGMVSSCPSNMSLTHKVIQGAVSATEMLSNSQFEQAIKSGMLVFSTSPSRQIWIESGVNTLITPQDNQDAGWSKIKRTKIRMELMDRIIATVDPLIGNINNDADGRSVIIQSAQGIINTMIAERKLLQGGKIVIDNSNPPVGESAWFLVQVDDIDSLEKMYFTFQYRFAPVA